MRSVVVLVALAGAAPIAAQAPAIGEPQPAGAKKVYEVPKEGLVIDGKLTRNDPPLANAPLAELKGAPHQVFQVKLVKGQSYVIELASKDFDAFLILEDAAGKRLAYDDDSGDGLNSRMVCLAKTDGVHRLQAAALDGKPGSFQLKIRVGELSEDEQLAAAATKLDNEGVQLYLRGQPAQALNKIRQSLAMRQRLFPESKYPNGHRDLAASYNILGAVLQAMGQAEQALSPFEQCLAMTRKLFPKSTQPDGHLDLALSINNLGVALQAMGQTAQGLPYLEESVAMLRRLFPQATHPDGHPELAQSLNSLGAVLKELGQPDKAMPCLEQSLAMRDKLYPKAKYPDGHLDIASSYNNLGLTLEAMGQAERALPYFTKSLAMTRKHLPEAQFPNGHPDLAFRLHNLGFGLRALGQLETALPYLEQSLAMRRKLFLESRFPNGHPDLAVSLNAVAVVLEALGQPEKASPAFEQSLAMSRKLFPESKFPNGHPNLAHCLNGMCAVLWARAEPAKALPYCEQSLAMKRKLFDPSIYPDGHPEIARSLNNLAMILEALGQADKALGYCEQSLAMTRRLYPASRYPDGHADIATNLNNMGFVHDALGQMDKALPYYEQSLAMWFRLFPETRYIDGHPHLAAGLNNLAAVLFAMGRTDKALAHCEQAVAMQRRLGRRYFLTASEAEALAFAQEQPLTRDGLLSLTLDRPDKVTVAYESVWNTKSAITRILSQRHAAARVAGAEQADQLDQLKGLRRRIDQLLQDRQLATVERDKLLTKATDERDALERALAKTMPTLMRARDLNAWGHADLAKLLPADAVLIDIVRYTRIGYDSQPFGLAKETRTTSYVAFVLTPSSRGAQNGGDGAKTIRRIELGAAAAIDLAVADWRTAIEGRTASPAPRQLVDLVWTKLAPHLPAGTKTLFIAPDGDLARLPWAALPIAKDRILLEDYALATVPHGPFLLEAFKFPREYRGSETVLLVGDLDYRSKTWPNLPGTAVEVAALAPLASSFQMTLTKNSATPEALAWGLRKARYAHIATHGYFDVSAISAEKQRETATMKHRAFGDDVRRVAAKNPLGFTGLILAGGDVLTGLKLIDLPLENLKLVTLSACETGLGEHTAGEGVQGLQRAFHIAGCPNVVASLWKVNDAATAALMAKFYHEMWVNKKPPIEALREAQLTIYRRPDLIPDLSGERGPPGLKAAVAAKIGEPSGVSRRVTADTKLWAAFVLSGAGK